MSTRTWRWQLWLAAKSVVGLSLAPALGGAVGLPVLFLVEAAMTGKTISTATFPRSMLGGVSFGMVFGGLYGAPVAFLIGWPLHGLLLRLQATGAIIYFGLGALIAALGTLLFFRLWGNGPVVDPSLVTGLLVAGAVGGLFFWLIRRPDRDAKTSEPAT